MVFAAEGYQEELVEVGEHAGTQHQTLHLVAGVAGIRTVGAGVIGGGILELCGGR